MIHLTNRPIVLGSNSPRRRELLAMLFDDFTIAASRDVDETWPSTLTPDQVPAYLSQLKARAYQPDLSELAILITADTVVIVDDRILGKPHDEAEAVAMLQTLRGRTHRVVTGVTITDARRSYTFSDTTEVDFADLTDDEIRSYVNHSRPLDKAGAYGIQEWIGAAGIRGIRGCFYNVMGLPMHPLYEALKKFVEGE